MKWRLVVVVTITASTIGGTDLVLGAEASGAVIVRIPDGASSRCINSSSDKVWLTMRRVILNKESHLFTTERYAGVIVNTTISGNTGSKTQKVSFPRMIEADIERYADGRGVSIPVEFGLLEGFRLRAEGARYTNVDFDFNVVKGQERNAWGYALNALVGITKRLPMPANPFAEGFQYFADYANSVVDSSVQEKNPDNIKQGNVRLSFSPNGKCANQAFESTGTIAIVFASPGTEDEGFFDIAKIANNQYCWSVDLRPAFTVKFGKGPNGGKCTATKTLRNDYYALFLNAVPLNVAAAPSLREDYWPATSWGSWTRGQAYSAAHLVLANFGPENPELVDKTVKALQWNPMVGVVPFGEAVATTKEPGVVWRATGVESSAFDIAAALRRCDANGVVADNCLAGVPLTIAE